MKERANIFVIVVIVSFIFSIIGHQFIDSMTDLKAKILFYIPMVLFFMTTLLFIVFF